MYCHFSGCVDGVFGDLFHVVVARDKRSGPGFGGYEIGASSAIEYVGNERFGSGTAGSVCNGIVGQART